MREIGEVAQAGLEQSSDPVRQKLELLSRSKTETEPESSENVKPRRAPDCPACGGASWLHRPAQAGDDPKRIADSVHGRVCAIDCPVCNGADKRQDYLQQLCGLRGGDLDSRFSSCFKAQPVSEAERVLKHSGWLTLSGEYGTGKTYLLTAIVNEARLRGVMAIYSTMSDLLDHLRRAYKPGAEVEFDALWENIIRCQVLCLDEVEKFSATPWADEKFSMMINERYRRWTDQVTVLATNSLDDVPGYLKSRAMDGRFKIVFVDGKDIRPELRR